MGRMPTPPATRGPMSVGGPSCPHPQRGAEAQARSGCSVKGEGWAEATACDTHAHAYAHTCTHMYGRTHTPYSGHRPWKPVPGRAGSLLPGNSQLAGSCSTHVLVAVSTDGRATSCPTQTRAWGLRLGATGVGRSHQQTSQDRRLRGEGGGAAPRAPLTGCRGSHRPSPPAVTGQECGLFVPYFDFSFNEAKTQIFM